MPTDGQPTALALLGLLSFGPTLPTSPVAGIVTIDVITSTGVKGSLLMVAIQAPPPS